MGKLKAQEKTDQLSELEIAFAKPVRIVPAVKAEEQPLLAAAVAAPASAPAKVYHWPSKKPKLAGAPQAAPSGETQPRRPASAAAGGTRCFLCLQMPDDRGLIDMKVT